MKIILIFCTISTILRSGIIRYVKNRYGVILRPKITDENSILEVFYKTNIMVPKNCPNDTIYFLLKYVYLMSGLLALLIVLFV